MIVRTRRKSSTAGAMLSKAPDKGRSTILATAGNTSSHQSDRTSTTALADTIQPGFQQELPTAIAPDVAPQDFSDTHLPRPVDRDSRVDQVDKSLHRR